MTPIELATQAVTALSGNGMISLVIPEGKYPKRFPRGELLNAMERNGVVERVYLFDAKKVLRTLVRQGLVKTKLCGNELIISEA